jgi:regulator of RNase E activity RraA
VPVELDGVGVLPGDWIFADNAGAVIIPDEDLEAVLDGAREIERRDADAVSRARASRPAPQQDGGQRKKRRR